MGKRIISLIIATILIISMFGGCANKVQNQTEPTISPTISTTEPPTEPSKPTPTFEELLNSIGLSEIFDYGYQYSTSINISLYSLNGDEKNKTDEFIYDISCALIDNEFYEELTKTIFNEVHDGFVNDVCVVYSNQESENSYKKIGNNDWTQIQGKISKPSVYSKYKDDSLESFKDIVINAIVEDGTLKYVVSFNTTWAVIIKDAKTGQETVFEMQDAHVIFKIAADMSEVSVAVDAFELNDSELIDFIKIAGDYKADTAVVEICAIYSATKENERLTEIVNEIAMLNDNDESVD